jgi:hypothetical protein
MDTHDLWISRAANGLPRGVRGETGQGWDQF